MNKLNEILLETGISKVKLARFLGVSRQMIYNYLEIDDIDKWPTDKKFLLLNLLGIKSANDLDNIKVDTNYIMDVEARIENIFTPTKKCDSNNEKTLFSNLGKKQKELLNDIINIVKEHLEDDSDDESYYIYKYLYHFMQAVDTSKELKYMLGYVSKATGFTKPLEFVFDEDEQLIFESIMFSGITLYNSGSASKSKIAESHKRFVNKIEHKREEKMSRTLELNTIKVQALKELGYTEINEQNAAEVFEKIAEIQSRNVAA